MKQGMKRVIFTWKRYDHFQSFNPLWQAISAAFSDSVRQTIAVKFVWNIGQIRSIIPACPDFSPFSLRRYPWLRYLRSRPGPHFPEWML